MAHAALLSTLKIHGINERFLAYIALGCGCTNSATRAKSQQFPPVIQNFRLLYPSVPIIRILIDPNINNTPLSVTGELDVIRYDSITRIYSNAHEKSYVISMKCSARWRNIKESETCDIEDDIVKIATLCNNTNSLVLVANFMGGSMYMSRKRIHDKVANQHMLIGLSHSSGHCHPDLTKAVYNPTIIVHRDGIKVRNPDYTEDDPIGFYEMVRCAQKTMDYVLYIRLCEIFQSVKEDFIDGILTLYRMIVLNNKHKRNSKEKTSENPKTHGVAPKVLDDIKMRCMVVYCLDPDMLDDEEYILKRLRTEEKKLFMYIGVKLKESNIDEKSFIDDTYGESDRMIKIIKSIECPFV